MAKKFDLSQYIEKTESKMDTRPRLAEVELHLIDAAPGNFYSMDGIDSLADNIALNGLLDPPHVREANGRYVVVSGHRRREALRRLVERGEMDPHDLVRVFIDPPVDVGDAKDADAARIALQQLRLIYANADNRQYTPADKAREVRELTEIFAELKRLGYTFPMKTRSMVAEAAKISESRAARLSVIEKNLTTPGLRAAFTDGRLGENAAYEIARRGADVIGRVEELPIGPVCGMTLDRLGVVLDGLEKKAAEDAAEAKAYGEGVKKLAEASGVYRPREEVDAYLAQRAEEDDAFFEMLSEEADSFFRQLGTVTSRQNGIQLLKECLGRNHHGWLYDRVDVNCSPKGVRLWDANGDSDADITRTWTDVYDMLCAIALNRAAVNIGTETEDETDDPSPDGAGAPLTRGAFEPEWMTGTPPRCGRYLCRVDMQTTKAHEQRGEWDGKTWTFYGMKLQDDWKVVGWWPLPKEG